MEITRSYKSLFNEIDFQTCIANKKCFDPCSKACGFQYFEGIVDDVFNDLGNTLLEKQPSAGRLITISARVVRAVLDYKIENPGDNFIDSFFEESLALGLDIYQRKPESLEEFNRFRNDISDFMGSDFLSRRISQRTDKWTWKSGNPEYSESSARYLNQILKSHDILFIALAHGGVAAGMDVFYATAI